MRWIYSASLLFAGVCSAALINSEKDGKKFLKKFDKEASVQFGEKVLAKWNYVTNVTDYNKAALRTATRKYIDFLNEQSEEAAKYDWEKFKNFDVRRQFEKLVQISPHSNDASQNQLANAVTEMSQIYRNAKVCAGTGKCLMFGRDSNEPMRRNLNGRKLLAIWKAWRDVTGKKIRDKFIDYVQISNNVAKMSGFGDRSEFWQSKYESETFQEDIERVLLQLRPLYEQLHSYIRRRLAEHYGSTSFPESGHIPAHLFDNVGRHRLVDMYDLVKPYPEVSSFNVTAALIEKGYNVADLFEMAQDFYTSLGFARMTSTFWAKSILSKPNDREMNCQPSSFDFSDGKDFRIKMCTNVTEKDVIAVHSQMGHTVYHMSYEKQPFLFRDGANPGFHGAMAGLAKLSFQTPEHLKILKLTSDIVDDNRRDINALMKVALETVAPLPFIYLVDKWRSDVFQGRTLSSTYNRDWWRLRCKYQGISPPVLRTEEDFDVGSEYHVSSNLPFIQKFVSTILKFQWHQALCNKGKQKQLHRCDNFQNKAAGRELENMLELGSSRPWPEALNLLTGSEQMNATPLIEYFEPLTNWLANENEGHRIGWDVNCTENESSSTTTSTISTASTASTTSPVSTASTTSQASTASTTSQGSTASTTSQASTASTVSQGSTASTTSPVSTASTTSQGSTASTISQGSTASTISQGSTASTTSQGSTASTISQGSTASTTSQGSTASTTSQGSTASTISQVSTASTTSQPSNASTTSQPSTASTTSQASACTILAFGFLLVLMLC